MHTKRINRLLNLVVMMALMLAWQPATSATATAVSGAQAAQMLPVEILLNSDGTLNTRTGASGALDLRGWSVTLDSARGPILTHDTPAPAALNSDTWSALGNHGVNGDVYALAVMGNDLYVGGVFTQTADGTVTNLNNIARYSGGTWSALAHNGLARGMGLSGVKALAVSGSDLYVGGSFTQTKDSAVTNLNHIARYSGGAWSALAHNGLNYEVYALAVSGSDLYVGGYFTQSADGTITNLNAIARYSGDAWSPLANNGLYDGSVVALAVSGSDLYVGGNFTRTADSAVTNLNHIARYSGGTWLPLANHGLNDEVDALAVSGGDLYAGGWFDMTADGTVTNLGNIARYSGSAWSALAHNGLNSGVDALAVIGNDLYVGGYFTQTKDGTVKDLNNIARYSGGAWSLLADNGLNSYVNTFAVSGSDLYVGGGFAQTFDGTVMNLKSIAKLGASVTFGYNCYLPLVIRK